MYIHGRGKIGYLIGETWAPDIKNPKYATWDAKNNMIMTWLVSSMDDDIGANYLCYSTTKELWDSVYHMYSDLENQSQVYELQLKLGEVKQGTDSISLSKSLCHKPYFVSFYTPINFTFTFAFTFVVGICTCR